MYGVMQANKLISIYIFRDLQLTYDNGEKTVECVCSLKLEDRECSNNIFFTGYMSALKMIIKELPVRWLLLEETAHNGIIVGELNKLQLPKKFISPTAFFFYNFAAHSVPAEQVMLIY